MTLHQQPAIKQSRNILCLEKEAGCNLVVIYAGEQKPTFGKTQMAIPGYQNHPCLCSTTECLIPLRNTGCIKTQQCPTVNALLHCELKHVYSQEKSQCAQWDTLTREKAQPDLFSSKHVQDCGAAVSKTLFHYTNTIQMTHSGVLQ